MRNVFLSAATLCGVLLASGVSAPTPAAAQGTPPDFIYPWCAYYGGRDGGGGTNCYFSSYGQCMAALSGNGGYCDANPMYRGPAPRVRYRYAPR